MKTVVCELCGTGHAVGLARCPSCGAVGPGTDPRLPVGTRLQDGRFTVGRVLGRGGFGITYKGAHTRLQRPVAVKELFPEFASRAGRTVTVSADRRAGFRRERASVVREARVLASLDAPGIVEVHDFFDENGTAYIVMEYLEGPTLEAEIGRRGRLPASEVVRVAEQVCAALGVLHGANLLHRDVKPANLLLARDDRVVLIDFGSVRAYEADKTQHQTIVVTPRYAAPEQFSQEGRFGPYTDLFCLGATLYHALTGEPPAPAMDRLLETNTAVSLPSSVPAGLRQAVEAALRVHIKDRPQSVAEFKALLNGATLPPVQNTGVPVSPTESSGASPSDGPFRFQGQQYHTPENLVEALCEAWGINGIDARNNYGTTLLHRAAREGHSDVVKALLEAGANDAAQDQIGNTPLHLAAREGHTDIVRTLLEAGTRVDVRDKNGSTPLHLAADKGRADIVTVLLGAGASVDAQDNDGDIPLDRATRNGRTDVTKALRDAGGMQYRFQGRRYHAPEDLATVLCKDWDAAVEEWRTGDLRDWLTEALGDTFEQVVKRMESDPLFMTGTSETATTVVTHGTAATKSIRVGQTRSGRVGRKGKDDLFKVSLQAGMVYRIKVWGKRRTSFHFYLNLFHPSGIRVEHSGRQYSGGAPVRIEYAPAQSGDYAIEVQGSSGDKGSYRLSVQSLSQSATINLDSASADMPEISVSSTETAVNERQLMHAFPVMDPNWKPSYRGMPLQDRKAIGSWCKSQPRTRRAMVVRCLTHGILLAHPKKFARDLHHRTLQECSIYRMHVVSRLKAKERSRHGLAEDMLMFRVFSILAGSRTTQESIIRARDDHQAMKAPWFAELVAQAANSPGCAVALGVLAPKARHRQFENISGFAKTTTRKLIKIPIKIAFGLGVLWCFWFLYQIF